jgi:hypothetical protein
MGNNDPIKGKLIDLELAKSDNKNNVVRRYLPAVVLTAATYYISMFLALGLAIGYFGSKIFSHYLLEKGKVDPIYIDCGKWKFHLHHWIMGAFALFLLCFVYKFYITGFFAGVIFGIMAHDIYDYNDWHKVLVRNEDYQEKR